VNLINIKYFFSLSLFEEENNIIFQEIRVPKLVYMNPNMVKLFSGKQLANYHSKGSLDITRIEGPWQLPE
jgi:hypothetical protein